MFDGIVRHFFTLESSRNFFNLAPLVRRVIKFLRVDRRCTQGTSLDLGTSLNLGDKVRHTGGRYVEAP